jgi:cytoskeletal protein CcmA (bactofilin family)
LTVGANGKIVAEVQAKTVMVLGEITGNITADDKVEVAATGTMRGDIQAPRVVLADGAKFKGSIDMDKKGSQPSTSASSTASKNVMEPVGAGASAKGAHS